MEDVIGKFDWVIREQGRFLYVPQEVWERLLRKDIVVIEFFDIWKYAWNGHPLLGELGRIEQAKPLIEEKVLFDPHLTDPASWKILATSGLVKQHGYWVLSDRSVLEFIGTRIIFFPRSGTPEDGHLIVAKYRYLPSRITRIAHETMEAFHRARREDPRKIIRAAEIFGVRT